MEQEQKISTATKYIVGITFIVCISLSLFHLFTAGFGVLTAMLQRNVHLTLILILVFLIYPISRSSKLRWIDFLAIIVTIGSGIYIFQTYDTLFSRVGNPDPLDFFFGISMIILVLEGTRRVAGKILPLIGLLFLVYAYFGDIFPGVFQTSSMSLDRIISLMYISTEGIWGSTTGIAATFIALFVIFGAFLNSTGAGKTFIDLAFIAGGRFRGGPAKVSVVSSALMGSVSGSAVANVSSTGQLTIPNMKKVGYKPKQAASIEAVSSAGGSIMPPVMGAGAFVMAELTGIPYAEIIVAALIPAILYYISIFIMVDLEAGKQNMGGLPKDKLPVFKEVFWKGIHLYAGIGTLIYLLVFLNYSPMFAAFWSIVTIVATYVIFYFRKINWKFLIDALNTGARGMLLVSMACATAGIVVGIINLTGVAVTLTSFLNNLGQTSIFLTLIVSMVACIIIGMGLPSTAAYIILGTLTAPALVNLGIEVLYAHLFVYYFASLAPITPPVALASYAGAGIAGSDPLKTSFTSAKMGIVAFIIPFMFVYGPELLMEEGTILMIVLSTFTAICGVFLFGISVIGWFKRELYVYERVMAFSSALLLVYSDFMTDVIGFTIAILLMAKILFENKEKNKDKNTNMQYES
ncbi:TRAP transporter permease [Salicibibacter cibarius]|uniref:TRAP transporter permease n=1 Tax=Salicibibacter cibarius TaxID=2743000 RepID=A0A7T6Z5L9_9BACI|nr:TRAP transporter permease [Salicibibacter cibarius]QQK77430.1 TRAP transporter permease [Salicibibacter cibarius]